jgi:hypothetical protein
MTETTQDEHLPYASSGLARLIRGPELIPGRPPKLVGRDRERDEIGRQLAQGEQVLLWGRPGTGKQALAATVSSDWLADEHGPVLWIDAGNLDYPSLLVAIRRSLQSGADGNLTKILQGNDVRLVVMANLLRPAALQTMQDDLPDGLPLLITANQPLDIEPAYEINFLHVRDAMQVLGLYARQRFGDGLEEHTLLTRLKFHTLGVAIAGQTMRTTGLSAGQLVERMDSVSAAETGLEKLFGAITDMLSSRAQRAFIMLGALLTPHTPLDLLALALGQPADTVQAALDELAAHGLARWEDLPDGQRMIALHHFVFLYASQPRPGYNIHKDTPAAIERVCTIYAEEQHAYSAAGVLARAKLRTLDRKSSDNNIT